MTGTKANAKEQNAFIRLCTDNDVEAVRRVLAANPDAVHWREDRSGETGLVARAGAGSDDCRIAVMLLDAGADVNVLPQHGVTALMVAMLGRNGSEAHVALLLDRGADYQTIRNKEGKTAEEIAKTIARPEIAAAFDKFRARKAQAQETEQKEKQERMEQEIAKLQNGSAMSVPVRKKPLIIKKMKF